MSGMLMELLQEFRKGDPATYAPLAEKGALRAEAEGGATARHRANRYWRVKAAWHALANDRPAQEAALIRAAETYVLAADEATRRPREASPNLHAAMSLERAILALKKIGTAAARTRQEELYRRLVAHQQKVPSEMPRFQNSVDLTEGARHAQEFVSDKPLTEALAAIGFLCKPPELAFLREQAEQVFQSPVMGLFGYTRIGRTGGVVARTPAYDSTPEGAEEATRAEMFKNARLFQRCTAGGQILLALGRVRAQHNAQLMDFQRIAEESPFVPRGREWTFGKGLYAGYTGDFTVSTHLLIPQIEHSIRLHLQAAGAATSKYNDQNLQNEFDLNTTLRMEGLSDIFGEDLVFDLRGLLIEHNGANLRNLMAHGLMEDGEFHSETAVYLWALTLRLCFLRPINDESASAPAAGSAVV